MRKKLVKYFEGRGCFPPNDLTDETINRVARKISEGQEIHQNAFVAYFYGVARNVYREQLRNPERNILALEALPYPQHPVAPMPKHLEVNINEQRIECLGKCLKGLPPETRALVVSYYEGEEAVKIKNRKQMAEAMGISLNNLRIRSHRIREQLENCIMDCIERSLN
ncbi:MAG: RNA polymerase sigma factor [Blastocatellia bacterium]